MPTPGRAWSALNILFSTPSGEVIIDPWRSDFVRFRFIKWPNRTIYFFLWNINGQSFKTLLIELVYLSNPQKIYDIREYRHQRQKQNHL